MLPPLPPPLLLPTTAAAAVVSAAAPWRARLPAGRALVGRGRNGGTLQHSDVLVAPRLSPQSFRSLHWARAAPCEPTAPLAAAPPELTSRLPLAHRSEILTPALSDYVGTILAKKGDITGPGSATDREFLQTEIRLLKQNLTEYERNANGEERKALQAGLAKQQDDQKDIFQYLNGELAKKTDEIVALEERVLKLEEENEQSVREAEQRLQSQKDADQQKIDGLNKRIGELEEQLEKARPCPPQPCPSSSCPCIRARVSCTRGLT